MKGIVYSASDKGDMIKDLLKSLKSVNKKSPNWKIHVTLTPPYPKKDIIKEIEIESNKVTKRENVTEPFKMGNKEARFCEKLAVISDSTYEDTIFLDCDTIVNYNLDYLLDGRFTFSARIAPSNLYSDWNRYQALFSSYGYNMPIINAGCMVFRNGTARIIGERSLEISEKLRKNSLMNFNPQKQYDQVSIVLAVTENRLSTKYMTKKDHGFRWLNENPNCTVYHGTKENPVKNLIKSLRGWYYHVS